MCLAVPVEITKIIDPFTVEVELSEGNFVKVGAALLPEDPKVGDYAIVHAGYIIRTLDKEEAKETLNIFYSMLEGQNLQ